MLRCRVDGGAAISIRGTRNCDSYADCSRDVLEMQDTESNSFRQPFKVIEAELPLPLAEVALEKRVKASTAEVYHVKKGQYIQIIDVSGQQASDFLAFDIEQLNKVCLYLWGNLILQGG